MAPHIFLSAGEPSGDLHAGNLARALLARRPDARLVGLGGDRMAAAGVNLRYPLTDLAVMWFGKVVRHLPEFFKLARQSEVYFRKHRPDALVMVDYPGFHFALAKRAHRAGVPVYWFVPPQLWAWHGSRVRKVRRWVKTVFTALPFEEDWYRNRGVNTRYVGHPYFDELATRPVDADWVRQRRGGVVAILPGSRSQEVALNGPLLAATADRVRRAVPGVRFLVAAFRDKHAAAMREHLNAVGVPAEVCVGRTPEVIRAADVAVAVSGSVGLELLYERLPSVIVYRTSRLFEVTGRAIASEWYVSLVNLLAGRELYPEVVGSRCTPEQAAGPLVRWLTDPAVKAATVAELSALRDTVAVPGACDRAATALLADLTGGPT